MTNPFDTSENMIGEPTSILLGSRSAWRKEFSIDSSLYGLMYVFTPIAGGTSFNVTGGTDDDENWDFEILAAATTNIAAGKYRWDMFVVRTSDSERILTHTGMMDVFATTGERRTHAEIMVAKLNSVIEGRADSDVESYTIGSRSITKMSPTDLMKWRDYYLNEVGNTGGSVDVGTTPDKNTVRVRFK